MPILVADYPVTSSAPQPAGNLADLSIIDYVMVKDDAVAPDLSVFDKEDPVAFADVGFKPECPKPPATFILYLYAFTPAVLDL